MSKLTFEVSYYGDGSFTIGVISNTRLGYVAKSESIPTLSNVEFRFRSDNKPQDIVNAYKKRYVPVRVEMLE